MLRLAVAACAASAVSSRAARAAIVPIDFFDTAQRAISDMRANGAAATSGTAMIDFDGNRVSRRYSNNLLATVSPTSSTAGV